MKAINKITTTITFKVVHRLDDETFDLFYKESMDEYAKEHPELTPDQVLSQIIRREFDSDEWLFLEKAELENFNVSLEKVQSDPL